LGVFSTGPGRERACLVCFDGLSMSYFAAERYVSTIRTPAGMNGCVDGWIHVRGMMGG
jgi:hypothetical protein